MCDGSFSQLSPPAESRSGPTSAAASTRGLERQPSPRRPSHRQPSARSSPRAPSPSIFGRRRPTAKHGARKACWCRATHTGLGREDARLVVLRFEPRKVTGWLPMHSNLSGPCSSRPSRHLSDLRCGWLSDNCSTTRRTSRETRTLPSLSLNRSHHLFSGSSRVVEWGQSSRQAEESSTRAW